MYDSKMYDRYTSRCYDNLSEMDFEESESKKIVSIEHFCYEVIKMVNGVKYLYNDMLIGAVDAVFHKRKIKCKESYKEVFDFVSSKLREAGWQYFFSLSERRIGYEIYRYTTVTYK